MACLDDAPESELERQVGRCLMYLRMLEEERLTFEEYGQLITLRLFDVPDESMRLCLETIPLELIPAYRKHLHDLLLPVDFMPSPVAFIAPRFTPEDIENKRRELRPKYIAIYQLVTTLSPAE